MDEVTVLKSDFKKKLKKQIDKAIDEAYERADDEESLDYYQSKWDNWIEEQFFLRHRYY